MMDLNARLKKFKEAEYDVNKEKYEKIINQQNPHTLFITCCDSRIDVEKMMQADPGEVFHIRDIANIVPRERDPEGHIPIVSSIEYAVQVLEVENVVVCGHSNCGGCAALMHLDDYETSLPHTAHWLRQSLPLRDYVREKYSEESEAEQLVLLEKLNVFQQLVNLMTYGFVSEKVTAGTVKLTGLYFNIATGIVSVYGYDPEMKDLLEEIAEDVKAAPDVC
ncbi:MAG: carbonic anhydrase [Bacillota bacterium]|nr:carbonic anhydrase [Bacillota bacterium]